MRPTATDRARQIRRVLARILVLNWAVAAAKAGFGLAAHSTALTADGLHSFVDGGSNVVGLIAMWVASRPPDDDHPYGHEKFEALAALAIGGMIAVVMFEMARSALGALISGSHPTVTPLTLITTAVTLAVNIGVTVYERRAGKRLNSTILTADAQHTLSDVGVSLAVLASLALARLNVAWLDGAVSLLVLGFVGWAAWRVIMQAVAPLADAARLDPATVRACCLAVEGVRDVRAVRSRGMEDAVRVDLTIAVDPAWSVEAGHTVATAVEAALARAFPQVLDAVVHIEPDAAPALRGGAAGAGSAGAAA